MRALVFVVLLGCGGGQSGAPMTCERTQPDSVCCLTEANCKTSEFCVPQGVTLCGSCDATPGTCFGDQDCKVMGPEFICDVRECACSGESDCVAGCNTDDDCTEDKTCNFSIHRCEPIFCFEPGQACTGNFDCVNGLCQRRECESNNECETGLCVEGQCHEIAGECRASS